MIKAARHGRTNTLRLLWDCNVNKDDTKQITKNEGWTPLHLAARLEYFSEISTSQFKSSLISNLNRYGKASIAQTIAEKMPDMVNSKDIEGNTPHMLACKEMAGVPCQSLLGEIVIL